MFVSVDGKAKEVKEIFAGGADGLAHKISEVFGSVDGVAKLIFTSAPHEPNAFDDLSWEEIKMLADAGRLLEFFHKGDKVNIKFKTPIEGSFHMFNKDCDWLQDGITLQICELTETGMKLVAYNATPLFHNVSIEDDSNCQTFMRDLANSSSNWNRWLDYRFWGLDKGAYNSCHMIDEKLPDDFRDVLVDFEPCIEWSHYLDHENKNRLRKTYDDCRVRQLTKSYYEYHREFVEENDRYEYILDFTMYPRSEATFKKYAPESIRSYWPYSTVRSHLGMRYEKDSTYGGDDIKYKQAWMDADISWDWDWENYGNTNQLDMINKPVYTTYFDAGGLFVPEMIIGTLPANEDITGSYIPHADLTDWPTGPI